MTHERIAMNSSSDLQFLNLDDATVEQKQLIENILFGNTVHSLVEFPWEASTAWKNAEFGASSQQSYHSVSTSEVAPTEELMDTISGSHDNASISSSPVHNVESVCNRQEQNSEVFSFDCKTYSAPSEIKSSTVTCSEKNVEVKVMPRRNKKKRPAEYFEKNNRQVISEYNVPVEESIPSISLLPTTTVLPLPTVTSHLTHMAMPVSSGNTVQPSLTQPAPGHFPHLAGHIQGPNVTPLAPYTLYTCPSQMMYPSGPLCIMTSSVYPSYAPPYASPPPGNLHLFVPTEQTVQSGPLHSAIPSDTPPELILDHPSIPHVLRNKTVQSQVPAEVYSQEKILVNCVNDPNSMNMECDNVIPAESEKTVDESPVNFRCDEASTVEITEGINNLKCTNNENNIESAKYNVDKQLLEHLPKSEKQFSSSNESSAPKSWASLFKSNSSPVNYLSKTNTECDVSFLANNNLPDNISADKNDSLPAELGEILNSIELDHHSVHFFPRGLSNSGNWCYINSTLQALLACPPFFNLMHKLPVVSGLKKGNSSIPVIDAVVEFVHEFVLLDPSQISKNNSKASAGKHKDDMFGVSFEPIYIYDMLKSSKGESFRGRQEDAEEFLSWILNKLHEEMVELMPNTSSNDAKLKNGNIASNGEFVNHVQEDAVENESDWLVMGHKNKSCTTRSIPCSQSPIQEIFGGQTCSMLQQAGSIKSKTLQPFFTLQLDIQAENVSCIKSALEGLVMKEALQGYTCSNTNQEVEASRKITLEKLPTVLILHLKRFVFDRNGGCRKLTKRIDFNFELELSKELLSSSRPPLKHRKYRLFAVVYHDGQEAAKGHYIADVYHYGYKRWLRTDDAKIKPIADNSVLKYEPPRVPYLLYYRRDDTIL